MTFSWVKNKGVIKPGFINFVLTPRAAALLDFTGGEILAQEEKWKKTFPARVSGSETLVH